MNGRNHNGVLGGSQRGLRILRLFAYRMRNPLSFWQIYPLDACFKLSRPLDINAKAAGMAVGRIIFEYQQRINRDWTGNGHRKIPRPKPRAGFNSGLLVGEYEHAERMDLQEIAVARLGLQLRSVYLQQ
ncbi:Uncharacterised protein [Serratia fonticola]|nr:Uncharacterised protein [Serratia fonticola]